MILAQVITNQVDIVTWVTQGVHIFAPKLSVAGCTEIVTALLTLSKFAQIAYKHWTTEGTKVDKIAKLVGVVQDAPNTVVVNSNLPITK